MIMSKYQTTAHVTYNIGYHIVFCPKAHEKAPGEHPGSPPARFPNQPSTFTSSPALKT